MSGSIGLTPPSYLTILFNASTPADSMLSTLFGFGGSNPATTSPIAALQSAQTGETKQVAVVAAGLEVKRDLAAFTKAVATAKTPADLLANPAALKVLLTANGLGSQAPNTALATKALLSNTAKSGSLASQLPDARWLSIAKTYDFANKGLTLLNDPKALAAVTNGYSEVLWRTNLNQKTPGLSNALDFLARAKTITSVDQVLGDPTFRDVVTTALAVPKQIAFQELGAQETAISHRIDVKKFQDPKFVSQFVQRYLIAAQQAAISAGGTNGAPDLTTLASQSAGLVV
jgi:Protein of unknown function (DUF1217)